VRVIVELVDSLVSECQSVMVELIDSLVSKRQSVKVSEKSPKD